MSPRRREPLGPVIRPLVVVVLGVIAALLIQQGPWLPIALVVAVLGVTFVVLALVQRRPRRPPK